VTPNAPPPPPPAAFVRVADLTDITIAALRRVNGEQAATIDAMRRQLADMADALTNLGEVLDREREAARLAHDMVAGQAATIAAQAREIEALKLEVSQLKAENKLLSKASR
jgi:cell division protein FtsB